MCTDLAPRYIDFVHDIANRRIICIEQSTVSCVAGRIQHQLTLDRCPTINFHSILLINAARLVILVRPSYFKILLRQMRQCGLNKISKICISNSSHNLPLSWVVTFVPQIRPIDSGQLGLLTLYGFLVYCHQYQT